MWQEIYDVVEQERAKSHALEGRIAALEAALASGFATQKQAYAQAAYDMQQLANQTGQSF